MLKEALSNKKVEQALYAGVLSVKKDQTAKDGRTFHVLEISDSEYKAKLYLWNPTCDFGQGDFVKFTAEVVSGQTSFFSCQIKDIVKVDYESLPEGCSTRKVQFRYITDVEALSKDIREFTEAYVPDEAFKSLIYYISEVSFLKNIETAPAGRTAHHSLVGGLLKHISEMFDIYSNIASSEVCKDLRHEFVVIGVILHDYYKFREYEIVDGEFKMTENGILLGHIYQGAQFLQKIFDVVTAKKPELTFSNLDKQKAIHTLLAHHGQMDWGSPVVPAIPEAIVLHYIDQISAKLNMFSTSNNMEFNKFLGTSPIK